MLPCDSVRKIRNLPSRSSYGVLRSPQLPSSSTSASNHRWIFFRRTQYDAMPHMPFISFPSRSASPIAQPNNLALFRTEKAKRRFVCLLQAVEGSLQRLEPPCGNVPRQPPEHGRRLPAPLDIFLKGSPFCVVDEAPFGNRPGCGTPRASASSNPSIGRN